LYTASGTPNHSSSAFGGNISPTSSSSIDSTDHTHYTPASSVFCLFTDQQMSEWSKEGSITSSFSPVNPTVGPEPFDHQSIGMEQIEGNLPSCLPLFLANQSQTVPSFQLQTTNALATQPYLSSNALGLSSLNETFFSTSDLTFSNDFVDSFAFSSLPQSTIQQHHYSNRELSQEQMLQEYLDNVLASQPFSL